MASSSKKPKTDHINCFTPINTRISLAKAKLLDIYSSALSTGKSAHRITPKVAYTTKRNLVRYASALEPVPPLLSKNVKPLHRRIPSMPTIDTAKANYLNEWKDKYWTERKLSRKLLDRQHIATFKFERFPVLEMQRTKKPHTKLDLEAIPQPPPNSDAYSSESSTHPPAPIQILIDIPRTVDMIHSLVSPINKKEDNFE